MKYLFDNCISPKFAKMLASLEIHAVALRDEHPHDISDVELFAKLKGSDCVFITCDRKQTTRENEARGIKESGITAIWFGPFWSKKQFWDQAKWLINRWKMIDGYVKGVSSGTCAEVKENGKSRPFLLR